MYQLCINEIPALILSVGVLVFLFRNNRDITSRASSAFYIMGTLVTFLHFAFCLAYAIVCPTPSRENWEFYIFVSTMMGSSYWYFVFGIIGSLVETGKSTKTGENLWLLFLYAVISLGLYIPIWFMKKSRQFGTTGLPRWLIAIYSGLQVTCFGIKIRGIVSQVTVVNAYETITIAVTMILFSMSYYVAIFSLQKEIQKTRGIEFNPLLTLLFGVLYTQYKVNEGESPARAD